MNHPPPQPPRWAQRFFRWYCTRSHREHLEGDLLELFERNARQHGIGKAKWMYVRDVLLLLRPFTLRRTTQLVDYFTHPIMILYTLKKALRSLRRHRSYTLINIAGFSLGLLAALFILLKVGHDLHFDFNMKDVERIYRVVSHGPDWHRSGMPGPVQEGLADEIPELEAMTVIDRNNGDPIVGLEAPDGSVHRFRQKAVAWVWPEHFEVFHHDWIRGDPARALVDPGSVVISESLAEKYFPGEDPIGRTIEIDGDGNHTVTGIIRDPAQSTNFPFHMLISKAGSRIVEWMSDQWFAFAGMIQGYVKLNANADVASTEAHIQSFLDRHRPAEDGVNYTMHLQPIREMHLDPRYSSIMNPTVSRGMLWALTLIAVFLLGSAIINFVNLHTAHVFQRSREIGVRKVLGSSRRSIFGSVLLEALLISVLSFALATCLLPLALKNAEALLGTSLSLSLVSELALWPYLMMLVVLTVLLAGLYPGWLMAKISPTLALKNKLSAESGKRIGVRKGLLVLQFTISQLLIVCTFTAMRQMSFFGDAPLGFDQSSIIEIYTPMSDTKVPKRIRNNLSQHPGVLSVCFSNTGAASRSWWKSDFTYSSLDSSELVEGMCQVKLVDDNYLSTYGIKLIAGDDFQKWDTLPYAIVNHQFLKSIGVSSTSAVLGNSIRCRERDLQIVGVVADFSTESLHKMIEPLVILPDVRSTFKCGIKLSRKSMHRTLAAIEDVWKDEFPNHLFEYKFLDETIEAFYKDERRATSLFQMAAGIAIFIGILGLFGLMSLTVARRTREIGIRRVLGSDLWQVLRVFMAEYVRLIFIGFLTAAPLAWLVMRSWLDDFHYRIDMGWSSFLWALAISLGLMALIVWLRSYRVVTMNPAEALREDT